VSIGLLQLPAPGQPPSYFRLEWQDHEDGRPLSPQEKLEIVHALAGGGRPATAGEFQRLMKLVYQKCSHSAGGQDGDEQLLSLISTIFSTIAASRDALSALGA
jgi:hypothetical protein